VEEPGNRRDQQADVILGGSANSDGGHVRQLTDSVNFVNKKYSHTIGFSQWGRDMPDYAPLLPSQRLLPVLSLSADGTSVAYVSDASGQFNIWTRPVAGGAARQLTFFTDQSVRQVAWAPDGTQLAFCRGQTRRREDLGLPDLGPRCRPDQDFGD
jgi:hypothetical protein